MMTEQIQKKKRQKEIPKELQDALDAIPGVDFQKVQPRVDNVFTIGHRLGWTDKQIGKLVRKKMRESYSKDTVRRAFEKYPEAQYKERGPGSRFGANCAKNEFECSKCHRPYVDPNTGEDLREREIWMFHADQFDIRTIHKAPRRYIEDALEHFYAKSLRVEKPRAKTNSKKTKSTQGTQDDKHDLFRAGLKRAVEERAKRGI